MTKIAKFFHNSHTLFHSPLKFFSCPLLPPPRKFWCWFSHCKFPNVSGGMCIKVSKGKVDILQDQWGWWIHLDDKSLQVHVHVPAYITVMASFIICFCRCFWDLIHTSTSLKLKVSNIDHDQKGKLSNTTSCSGYTFSHKLFVFVFFVFFL